MESTKTYLSNEDIRRIRREDYEFYKTHGEEAYSKRILSVLETPLAKFLYANHPVVEKFDYECPETLETS